VSTAPRFFIETALAPADWVDLPTAVAHHALRVLRLRAGDEVTVFNGRGGEFHGLLQVSGVQARVRIERHVAIERESPLSTTLIQAWIAADKLDWVIEKAVELGVARVVIGPSARSVVRLDAERRERRLRRLNEIAVAACCQSGRNVIPRIDGAPTLREALQLGQPATGIGLLLDPEATVSIVEAADAAPAITLVVGPEGGFDDTERTLVTSLGYRAVSIGPRILRTETAGLAALAVLQSVAGDLK
jgi:16S rRNA (uracil1498-N3)-methyltransferase